MPDRPEAEFDQDSQSFIDDTLNLFNTYSKERENWSKHAKEDKEFRLGRQWTQEQEDIPIIKWLMYSLPYFHICMIFLMVSQ